MFQKGTLAFYRKIAADQNGQQSKAVKVIDRYIAIYGLDQQVSID